MRAFFKTITTIGIFINLYISLTFFWRISENLFSKGEFTLPQIALFLVILTVVIRHAQIIEVSYDISRLSPYLIGIVALTLPQIKTIVDLTTPEIKLLYLIISLIFFEALRLPSNGENFSLLSRVINIILLLILILVRNQNFSDTVLINSNMLFTAICILLCMNISYSLVKTCLKISPHISDRFDLYSLAYFSVASVLFNYCSENLTLYAEQYLKKREYVELINSISMSQFLLFVFWVTVLVRIVQSLHLAALDYKDTQLKGIDLAVLSLFYIFISTYWLISAHPEVVFWLFVCLCFLSSIVSVYFGYYMRFRRLKKEKRINIEFDNRIQTVNALTFATVAFSNLYLSIYGYNYFVIIIQIFALFFNMIHSYQLTMWIKFDLIYDSLKEPIKFQPINKRELPKIASYLNYYFGYIYRYVFGVDKRNARKLIYEMLSSSSRFSEFGRYRFFWLVDNSNNEQVGMICLKSSYNSSFIYNFLSILSLLFWLAIRIGPIGLSHVLKNVLRKNEFLRQIDLSSKDESIEIAYLILHRKYRRKGYVTKIVDTLRNTNISNKSYYPEKQYNLKSIYLLTRESNRVAMLRFTNAGFNEVKTVIDNDFEMETSQGHAKIMNCTVKEI